MCAFSLLLLLEIFIVIIVLFYFCTIIGRNSVSFLFNMTVSYAIFIYAFLIFNNFFNLPLQFLIYSCLLFFYLNFSFSCIYFLI